jgi:Zn-finger nucleic acid-binding protein
MAMPSQSQRQPNHNHGQQAYTQSYPQGYKRKSWLEDIFD